MPIWMVGTIEDEPEVTLFSWQVYEAHYANDVPTRHFVGRNAKSYGARVSSAIQAFDITAMRGLTESGRVYELRGPACIDTDGEYVWRRWCAGYDVVVSENVTNDVLGAEQGHSVSPAIASRGHTTDVN